jgi:hypothetical protein
LDQTNHLVPFGKSLEFILGKDQLVIELYVENPVAPFDQFRFDLEFLLDSFRQTGGMGQVVSLHAVLDADLHIVNLARKKTKLTPARYPVLAALARKVREGTGRRGRKGRN